MSPDLSGRQGILPFRIERSEESLVARGGLVLPYEVAEALSLPRVIDRELPSPGSGRGYRPSHFVMPLVLMLHGGGKKLEELREIEGEVSLRGLLQFIHTESVFLLPLPSMDPSTALRTGSGHRFGQRGGVRLSPASGRLRREDFV